MKINSAEFVLSCVKPEQYPRERLPEVAFAGRSNVGKSSTINSLLNRKKLSKVSVTPGKTQTLNFFRIKIADKVIPQMYFVDLPGYGYAKVSKSVREQWGPTSKYSFESGVSLGPRSDEWRDNRCGV